MLYSKKRMIILCNNVFTLRCIGNTLFTGNITFIAMQFQSIFLQKGDIPWPKSP